MKLARKVKKLSRVAVSDEPAHARRLGDMLEDPYSLMTMSPALLSPSPTSSPSQATFADAQQAHKGPLKRSATVGNNLTSAATVTQGESNIQRARSVAALQPRLAIPAQTSPSRTAPISPIIFARPEGSSTSVSDTSSALYSESLVPSRTPSIIHSEIKEDADDDGESPLSDAPTTDIAADQCPSYHDKAQADEHVHDITLVSAPSSPAQPADTEKPTFRASDDVHPTVLLRAASPAPSTSRAASPPPARTALLQPPRRRSSRSLSPRPTTAPSPTSSLFSRSRPPSPSDAASSADRANLPEHNTDLRTDLPPRSASLRRVMGPRAPAKRRLSLDLRALSPEPLRSAKLRKGRSMLASRKVSGEGKDTMVEEEEEEGSRLGEPMSDQQRAMNVRRARKMMQLFGDKPPKELFQVAPPAVLGKEDAVDAISILTTVSENRRDSRATFTSVASSTISLTVHRRVRDSVQSSASEPPSPLVFTGAELAEDARTHTHPASQSSPQLGDGTEVTLEVKEDQARTLSEGTQDSDSEDDDDERELPPLPPTPSTPVTVMVHHPRPKPSIQSLSIASTMSHSRTHSLHSQAPLNPHGNNYESEPPLPPLPAPPYTPPPFSDVFMTAADESDQDRERERAQSPPPEEFRARRLRAAKLSRFFGVAPRDLADVLPAPGGGPAPSSPTSSLSPHHHHRHEHQHHPPRPHTAQGHVRKQSTTVEVAAEVPRAFRLGRSEKKAVQELDMADVLDQLRRMR